MIVIDHNWLIIYKLPWEGGLRQSTTQHGLPYPCKRHNQVSAIYCLSCQPDQCFSFWSYLKIIHLYFFSNKQTKRYFQIYQWCHRPVRELPKPLQYVFLQMSSQPSNTWSLPIPRHGKLNFLLWKYTMAKMTSIKGSFQLWQHTPKAGNLKNCKTKAG